MSYWTNKLTQDTGIEATQLQDQSKDNKTHK